MSFRGCRDLRDMNQRYLKVEKYGEYQDPVELLQALFREYIPQQP